MATARNFFGLFFAATLLSFASSYAAVEEASACMKAPSGLIEPGTLTVGVSLATPPTAFLKDDVPSGLDPDLINAIAKKMCVQVKFVNMAFPGLFPALLANKVDLLHSQIGMTEPRKQIFDFVPVSIGGVRLVTSKKSGLTFKDEMDACGYTVAVLGGAIQQAAMMHAKDLCPPEKPLTIKTFGGQIEMLNEVTRGSAQVAFVDWGVAAYAIQQRPDDFAIASPILSGKGPGTQRNVIGITFRKGSDENVKVVQEAFAQVEKDGTYDAILKKWNMQEGDVRTLK